MFAWVERHERGHINSWYQVLSLLNDYLRHRLATLPQSSTTSCTLHALELASLNDLLATPAMLQQMAIARLILSPSSDSSSSGTTTTSSSGPSGSSNRSSSPTAPSTQLADAPAPVEDHTSDAEIVRATIAQALDAPSERVVGGVELLELGSDE
ncbi:hypothetical protein BCR44DRAFT_45056 [Catenaria anguillulae PL171]|uniref:Uncharacterized protein n=1 Tax=Catenaria anguillulae PL171 TaxID=765915 RepID=A0A1Y2HX67_9FUNG|nr:hypothetical protein BCR44DRAFT_45056 [Catenaria anguillulae PL171]